jgi:hypothetical protein
MHVWPVLAFTNLIDPTLHRDGAGAEKIAHVLVSVGVLCKPRRLRCSSSLASAETKQTRLSVQYPVLASR